MAQPDTKTLRTRRTRTLGHALALTALMVSSVVACAQGSEVSEEGLDGGTEDGSVGTADGQSHDDAPGKRKKDAQIDTGGGINLDAAQVDVATDDGGLVVGAKCPGSGCIPPGECTTIGADQYCIEPCPAAGCPTGTYCSIIGGTDLCVPDLGQECDACQTASSCKLPSDACLTSPLGEKFCARDCTVDDVCPTGYTCQTPAEYLATDAGVKGDASAAGDAGGGSTGDASAPYKWCVPENHGTCSCSSKNSGATETCTITNTFGTCSAPAICDGTTGQWQGCPAAPSAEICNGKDDNCSGQIDEGNPNTLCAFMGPPPPNANWACTNAMCVIGACDTGWANFPPGPASAGCTCPVNAAEPNALCAQAASVGSIQTGAAPIVINSTLSSATDVNVWTFNTVDVIQSTTDTYNISLKFTAPATNTEFIMDVIRGSTCSDMPTGPATAITSYDWCVNGTSGANGELTCGATAANHCTDESSVYFIRVYRAASATPTCTPYQITINASGTTCDMTQQCQ